MTNPGEVLEDLWFAEDANDEATMEASQSFAAKLAGVDGLKTFPVVAQQVLSLLTNPNFEVREVASLLSQDPSLAAGVLRMANSAFFTGSQATNSLEQALVRLGSRSVREVVAAVATMDLFPDSGGVGKQVRDHCAATAAVVQYLAREFAPKHAEGVFLCGLMHDVGKMLLIESREIDYASEGIEAMRPDTAHVEERSLLGYDHAVLGGHVLRHWKLPEPIPRVVAWHHQPSRAYQDDHVGSFVALLRVADQLEPALRKNPPNVEEILDKVAGTTDCERVCITTDDLKSRFQTLLETRTTALELFGG